MFIQGTSSCIPLEELGSVFVDTGSQLLYTAGGVSVSVCRSVLIQGTSSCILLEELVSVFVDTGSQLLYTAGGVSISTSLGLLFMLDEVC